MEGLFVGDDDTASSTLLLRKPTARLFGFDWSGGYCAPFLGIHVQAAHDALDAAAVTAQDQLVDLGCGDGRICWAATQRYGATAVGVDLDATLIQQAATNHGPCDVSPTFRVQDLFEVDLEPFTVVTLFLLPETLQRLAPRLQTVLERSGRVVSFGWNIPLLGKPVAQSLPSSSTTGRNSNEKQSPKNDDDDDDDDDEEEDYNGLLKLWYVYGPASLSDATKT